MYGKLAYERAIKHPPAMHNTISHAARTYRGDRDEPRWRSIVCRASVGGAMPSIYDIIRTRKKASAARGQRA